MHAVARSLMHSAILYSVRTLRFRLEFLGLVVGVRQEGSLLYLKASVIANCAQEQSALLMLRLSDRHQVLLRHGRSALVRTATMKCRTRLTSCTDACY